jgi:hypothetical protein
VVGEREKAEVGAAKVTFQPSSVYFIAREQRKQVNSESTATTTLSIVAGRREPCKRLPEKDREEKRNCADVA